MAVKSQRSDLIESCNYCITSTPCVPSSTADNGGKCYTNSVVDSGYFTLTKPAVSKLPFAIQHESFPPLNLDITEDNTGPACDADCIDPTRNDLSECRENVSHECQSRICDVTNIYSNPDVVDQLDTNVHSASENHSSDGSLHEEHHICIQQRIDIISQLRPCFWHIVALILSHMSDSDLCR